MKIAAIPQDEQARLEMLRSLSVLDTPPEERFDRLTRLAKRMFGAPIALVSLVDENRQWFKSCVGLGIRESSRNDSFCGHAILGTEVFIIPDALEDERFADNPLVLGDPHIRFYAGCPLRVDGRTLGTLCIIDQKPRTLDKDDTEAFRDLAAMAERELAAIQVATRDELTRIPNRRGFMALAPLSLKLCSLQNLSASLIFLDLDKFKPINDTFGHAEGDRALTAFSDQIKGTCRDADLFARLGGDEFVVLLSNTSKQSAEEVVVRFSKSLENYNREASRGYNIAFSYGIVDFDGKKHITVEKLLADGDAMMYQAKKAKR